MKSWNCIKSWMFIRLRPETTDESPWGKAKGTPLRLRRMFALFWKRGMNNWKGATAFKLWGSMAAVSAIFVSGVQALEPYTWQDCLQEAKKQHPDLISAREAVVQSRADKVIAASGIFPQLTGTLTGSSKKASSGTDETYAYGLSGSQLLFDGFKTFHQIQESRQLLSAAEYSYLVTSSNIRLRLRRAFVEILREQELINITEEIVKRRRESMDLVRLRYDAGREHKGALLLAQANLAQAQAEVAQVARRTVLAQRRLGKELGRTQFVSVQVQGNFEAAELEPQAPEFEHLAETTPLLRELMAQREAAQHGLKSAGAEYVPSVFADGNIGRSESRWPPENETWTAGLRISWPLWDGGDRKASVQKAGAAFHQARAEEQSGRDSVILTLHETWAGLQDALDNVEVRGKFLESAEARARISEAQYSNGLISFDDWIIIEDALVQAKKNYLEAKANALIAEADWIQAKGGTLDNEN